MGGTALAWQTLARLAWEGDVSGIEDWIEMCRTESPDYERTLRWVEDNLHHLNLSLLENNLRVQPQTDLSASALIERFHTTIDIKLAVSWVGWWDAVQGAGRAAWSFP